MKFTVDSWDPSYGSSLDGGDESPGGTSSAKIDPGVERPVEAWEPLAAPADRRPPDVVLFVDGVRRIDATVWVEQSDAAVWPGIAASYAAGVVRCDLRR